MNNNTIKVNLEESNILTRWPCALCGGRTEKHPILPTFKDEDGDDHIVCEQCLEAGSGRVRERIGEHIAGLEDFVRFLRFLAQQDWELPTMRDFIKAESKYESEYLKHLPKKEREELQEFKAELPF